MFVQLGLGGMRRWWLLVQSSLSPDGCQASTHALLMSTASASPALLFVLVVLQAGGLCLSCRILGLGMVCVFTPQDKSPPISSFFSSQMPPRCPNLMLFSPFYIVMQESFLQTWFYRSSATFQLVFQENCSTCRCIFYVFVGAGSGELYVPLLCHLDPPAREVLHLCLLTT